MLTQQVEVGCAGVVHFLWCTCVISECAQSLLLSPQTNRCGDVHLHTALRDSPTGGPQVLPPGILQGTPQLPPAIHRLGGQRAHNENLMSAQ